jgi:hypothetical protein
LIYSFRILYDQGADRPFTFEITNYYAPVITKEDGTLNVQKGDSPTSVSTNLSFMEVSDLYDCIQCNKENFERYVYAEKRKEADRFSYDNYTARVQNVNYAPVSQPLVR